jgi:2-polyprenyl-3-methyl-5-hydroxy-6-metoxy-1,4-benzoquinol methylase
MRPVQAWARKGRIQYFLPFIHTGDRVLEIGSGEGWFQQAVAERLAVDYLTMDTDQPADIRGDIRDWQQHGLSAAHYDVIVAFEVVEHVDCFAQCLALLKPGGRLLITTPVPHMDWLLKIVEALRLTQQRTSPHSNLVYLNDLPGFTIEQKRTPFGIGQWAVFRKVTAAAATLRGP